MNAQGTKVKIKREKIEDARKLIAEDEPVVALKEAYYLRQEISDQIGDELGNYIRSVAERLDEVKKANPTGNAEAIDRLAYNVTDIEKKIDDAREAVVENHPVRSLTLITDADKELERSIDEFDRAA